MEKGGGVVRDRQVFKYGHIRKGLVHDGDDVHRLGDGAVPLHRWVLLHQLQHLVVAVILRLVHRAVPHGHGEVQQEAVGLGHPLLGVDPQGRETEKRKVIPQNEEDEPGPQGLGHLVPLSLGSTEEHHGQIGHKKDQGLLHLQVDGEVEGVGHIGRRPPGGQIGGEQNAPPEPEHIVVDQSHQKANRRRQGRRPPPPAQRQTAHHEPYVVPDQVHQHLPGVEIGEHVVLI